MHTFPRQNRIRKRSDYLLCAAKGKKIHTMHFIVRYLRLEDLPGRFGITVSKKIGNAVARNRVKRVLREFYRKNRLFLPDWQLLVVAKKGADKLKFSEVEAELNFLKRFLENAS